MNSQDAKLLLIEDDPRDAELTLNALRGHPFAGAVRVARDGQEALDLLFGRADDIAATILAPKVILLDLRLPKVNGLQVLQRIRGEPRTRGIPVIVLISSPCERDIVERHGYGVTDYILKPGDFDDFTSAIRAIGQY
jgi:CheY-like chemotaxis protein